MGNKNKHSDNSGSGCIILALVITLSLVILINSLPAFIIFISAVIVIYILNTYSNIKQQKIKLIKYKDIKQNLIETNNYRYIKSFVVKYKNLDYEIVEFDKLRNLLTSKGISIDDEALKTLINEEESKQDYEEFREKILFNKPDNLEQYILNLIEIYGENYTEHLDYFTNILSENLIQYSEQQLEENIKTIIDKRELEQFEKNLENENISSISIEDVNLMTGYEFENFLTTLFQKMGYIVEHTKLSGDQGADLIISKFGEKVAIQAKRYTQKVTNKAIQEIAAAIKHYGADKGLVITNSEFTRSAKELADSNNIELIDNEKLEILIRKYF